MNRPTRLHSAPQANLLEQIHELAADARDIIRDQQRRELPEYDDTEESTARHEMPAQNFHFTVNAGTGTPSHPELEVETEVSIGAVKVKGLPKWLIALAIPAAGAITAFVTWLLSR